MDLGLSGPKAVVLGVSQGLGLAIAHRPAEEGAHVVLAARNAGKFDVAVAEIRADGEIAMALPLDLADPASVAAALANPMLAGADILVLNGGGPAAGPVAAADSEAWKTGFDNMVAGPVRIATALLSGMRERGWGRGLYILSSGVVQPIPSLGLSNGLRTAVASWAKILSAKVQSTG